MGTTPDQRRRAAIAAAPAPAVVTAYACGRCPKVFTKPEEARECCACSTCGTKFFFASDTDSFDCGHCAYPRQVRNRRECLERDRLHIARLERDWKESEAKLAKLLDTPRPPKGSVPEL